MIRRPPRSTLFPYTTLFRSRIPLLARLRFLAIFSTNLDQFFMVDVGSLQHQVAAGVEERSPDRKSTRLNSSHLVISYAVFCLKKKKNARRMSSLWSGKKITN